MNEKEANKPCPFCGSTDIKCAMDEWGGRLLCMI